MLNNVYCWISVLCPSLLKMLHYLPILIFSAAKLTFWQVYFSPSFPVFLCSFIYKGKSLWPEILGFQNTFNQGVIAESWTKVSEELTSRSCPWKLAGSLEWDLQEACGVFSSQWEPWLLSAAALQERGITAGLSHAEPLAISTPDTGQLLFPPWCTRNKISVLLCRPCCSLEHWSLSCCFSLCKLGEICCPGFERIVRRFTWFMSKPWYLKQFQEEAQELESGEPKPILPGLALPATYCHGRMQAGFPEPYSEESLPFPSLFLV